MADITQKIIDLDTKCADMVAAAEREASAILSEAQRQSRKIVSEAQKEAAKRRHREFSALEESLKELRLQKEEELKSKKERLVSRFAGKKTAKEIAQKVVLQFVTDLQKGM